jgi:hypothetical protein
MKHILASLIVVSTLLSAAFAAEVKLVPLPKQTSISQDTEKYNMLSGEDANKVLPKVKKDADTAPAYKQVQCNLSGRYRTCF